MIMYQTLNKIYLQKKDMSSRTDESIIQSSEDTDTQAKITGILQRILQYANDQHILTCSCGKNLKTMLKEVMDKYYSEFATQNTLTKVTFVDRQQGEAQSVAFQYQVNETSFDEQFEVTKQDIQAKLIQIIQTMELKNKHQLQEIGLGSFFNRHAFNPLYAYIIEKYEECHLDSQKSQDFYQYLNQREEKMCREQFEKYRKEMHRIREELERRSYEEHSRLQSIYNMQIEDSLFDQQFQDVLSQEERICKEWERNQHEYLSVEGIRYQPMGYDYQRFSQHIS